MTESISSKAHNAIKSGDFPAALKFYETLGSIIGTHLVQANIKYCLKKLSIEQQWPMHFSGCSYDVLINNKNFSDAQYVLYADIDLNTVDGSAIWMSSMASILALNGKTIVISKNRIKRSVVIENILKKNNVLILTPDNIDPTSESLGLQSCVDLIKKLDHILGSIRTVVVRGLAAASALVVDRQFHGRLCAYLTDFYRHTDAGIEFKDGAREAIDILSRQSRALLVQTPKIEHALRKFTSYSFEAFHFPPPIPSSAIEHTRHVSNQSKTIEIGYAGKIAPAWGIQQLIDWVERARHKGINVNLTIIGDKISGAGTPNDNKKFRSEIVAALKRVNAKLLGVLSRNEALEIMNKMDFSWCWRPPEFEESTLELSTKLIEGVAAGQACLTFPSATNLEALGADYPFFIRQVEDFFGILSRGSKFDTSRLRKQLHESHSIESIARRFREILNPKEDWNRTNRKMCIATHDPKFIYAYYSRLKRGGMTVTLDEWGWGEPLDESRSRNQLPRVDIVFCEWGLANAVWYSRELPQGKKLIIRIHLQEINPRAAKFGRMMNHNRVDLYIFVSDRVKTEAIRMFGIDPGKTRTIPNFVLGREYAKCEKPFDQPIKLGIVGIIPQRKRFDRAINLLQELLSRGLEAELYIKGPRPENIEWMKIGSRADELGYYFEQYARIEKNPLLNSRVFFEGWGNDVALFYEHVDYILSPSDFESFHYALADGVLSGCYPVVWPWDEAADIYTPNWIVRNEIEAADVIVKFHALSIPKKKLIIDKNRAMVLGRYGSDFIFKQLDSHLELGSNYD